MRKMAGHTHPNIATLGFISVKDDGSGPRFWAIMLTADQALQVTGMAGKHQHLTVLESDHGRGSLLSLSEKRLSRNCVCRTRDPELSPLQFIPFLAQCSHMPSKVMTPFISTLTPAGKGGKELYGGASVF